MRSGGGIPILVALSVLAMGCAPDDASRLRTHFDDVLRELRSAPIAHLTSEQRSARDESIAWLDEYRARGVFPHNHVRVGERVPVFVDPHGTPCAVGYLLLRSGEDELVADVVREANLAYVEELEHDARLRAWLEHRGLTLAEAARIQPTYGQPPPPGNIAEVSDYAGTTVGLSIVSIAALSYSMMTDPRVDDPDWPGILNVGTFLAHALVGVLASGDGAEPGWAPAVNLAGALWSAVAAYDRLGTHGRRASAPVASDVTLAPFMSRRGDTMSFGLSVRH